MNEKTIDNEIIETLFSDDLKNESIAEEIVINKDNEGEQEANGDDFADRELLIDQLRRLKADFINFKRNSEIEGSRKYSLGLETVLEDLITVQFELERALETAEECKDDPLVAGIRLVMKKIDTIIKKHGYSRIETVNTTFDPIFHEAISSVPAKTHEPNDILAEAAPGLRKAGRCIIPAKVVVVGGD